MVQDGNTDEMIWDMHYLVADIARTITLEPGDVLLSGTPANSRPVQPGDVVEVEVDGLGTLRNTIVEGTVPIREDVGAQPSESEEVISTDVRRRLGVPRDPRPEEGLKGVRSMATVRYLVDDVDAAVDVLRGACWGSSSLSSSGPRSRSCDATTSTSGSPARISSAARPMPDGAQPIPGGWNRLVVDDRRPRRRRSARLALRWRDVPQRHRRRPGGRQILVEDPSGNVVELFERA